MSDFPLDRLTAALADRYTVERKLGEGGMATVFVARDLKHNRNVALKVLKPELAAVVGAERFLAEIETTANLQHPHILPLFDSGEADSFLFYVMPFVQGETLRDRIEREKQLPVDEAVRIAASVADALQHAHERGVIHRDIKPANILLQDGQPVISDFGIALAVGAAGGSRLTETGLSVGTPFYMSPEQATGDQQVGPASDTYALAAVLYEMLTGDPPYPGSTAQAVLGKIIQGEPVSPTRIRRSVPLNVDAAIRKALEKLPADRFTGAREFASALGDPAFRHRDLADAATSSSSRLRWLAVSGWAAAVLVGALAWSSGGSTTPAHVERFAVPFLAGEEPRRLGGGGYDLSPDGTMLVYRHNPREGQILMIRRWDDLAATPVRETLGAGNPAVSPDGLELAFDQGGEVKVLTLAGGPVRTLTAGGQPEWGPDGFVYATTDSGVVRVPATGGAPEYVTRRAEGEGPHQLFDVLPGGRGALIGVGGLGTFEIRTLDLRSGEMETLLGGADSPRYLPSGHLVYRAVEGGTMMAVRFDPGRMEVIGTPVAVMDGAATWSLSDDGKLFYAPGEGVVGQVYQPLQLLWVTREGASSPIDPDWVFQRGGPDTGWDLSPDGTRLAIREYTTSNDVWIKRLDDGPRSRLTFGDFDEWKPRWVPGTNDVAFLSNRLTGNADDLDVWARPADGTQEAELILDFDLSIATFEWSPDADWLIFRTAGSRGGTDARDIYAFRPGVDTEPAPLLASPDYGEVTPAISPDGRFIAYSSSETGRYEVNVRPFPEVNSGRWQVSVDGGATPRWAPSGRELFFSNLTGDLLAVDVETASGFSAGTPRVLFERRREWISANYGLMYEVAPDGQRFVIARVAEGEEESGPSTILVNNFVQVLEAQLPR